MFSLRKNCNFGLREEEGNISQKRRRRGRREKKVRGRERNVNGGKE